MRPQDPRLSASSFYFIHTPSLTARKLYLYPVCLGDYTYLPGYTLSRSHFHNVLIFLVVEGSLTLHQEDETFQASSGMAGLLDCRLPHRYETARGCRLLWLHFDGILAFHYYEEILRRQGRAFPISCPGLVNEAFSAIFQMFQDPGCLSEPSLSIQITRLLDLMLTSGQSVSSGSSGAVAEACAYINRHFTSPIPLSALAERAALDPFYFSRLFHRETGMSPHQYLMETRISCARYLLKSTSLSIKAIAARCGFSSESHFCSCFKKREGISPSGFRNQP